MEGFGLLIVENVQKMLTLAAVVLFRYFAIFFRLFGIGVDYRVGDRSRDISESDLGSLKAIDLIEQKWLLQPHMLFPYRFGQISQVLTLPLHHPQLLTGTLLHLLDPLDPQIHILFIIDILQSPHFLPSRSTHPYNLNYKYIACWLRNSCLWSFWQARWRLSCQGCCFLPLRCILQSTALQHPGRSCIMIVLW